VAGFEVEIDALRRAGEAAGSAGGQAGAVDLAEVISNVGGALPGGRCGRAATAVAEVWRGQISDFSGAASALGREMAAAADGYAACDDAARRDLSGWLQALAP